MKKIETKNLNKYENFSLFIVFSIILIIAIIQKDNVYAVISAFCGITYTFLAGKGLPICYLFGVSGSAFYSILALQNSLWGNLFLYSGYYLPMQILGYFRWKKYLKFNKNEIIKISLTKKELLNLILILILISLIVYKILLLNNDTNPVLDSITTVFSIGGMYLTVRRAIEQWIFWMIVNLLSLIMWINVAISGVKIYSTIIMWLIYLFLAVYFYYKWHKELINK